MTKTKISTLITALLVPGFASAGAIGPLSIKGTIKSVTEKFVELQADGATVLIPKEYVPKNKLQSKSQITLELDQEQILEVQVK